MAIKNLEMRARVVVEGFWERSSSQPLPTAFRLSLPSIDNTRPATTRVTSTAPLRPQRLNYTLRVQDETNLRCHLLVDGSRL